MCAKADPVSTPRLISPQNRKLGAVPFVWSQVKLQPTKRNLGGGFMQEWHEKILQKDHKL